MKKKVLVISLILILFVVITSISVNRLMYSSKVTSNTTDLTVVKLTPVTVKTIPEIVEAIATLNANKKAVITPKIAGYISNINFQEGQFIKQDEVLFKLDNSSQMQAYLFDQAATQFAKVTAERYQKLLKSNAAAKQDIDQYLSKYKQALAKEKSDKITLSEMTLHAPISGYIGTTNFNLGDFVNAGSSLVTLTDLDHLKVEYSLPSFYAPKLKLGQKVIVSSDFLPKKDFEGKVTYIAPTVEEATQTIEVHASLDNSQHLLKPGESVAITQYLGSMPNSILVPSDAVIASVGGNNILQVNNNKVISTPVVIGTRFHGMTLIEKGLTANSHFISEGQFQVQAGQQVQVAN